MSTESKRQWMQSCEGKIRVGPEYQAMIPPFYKSNVQQSQNRNGQNTANGTASDANNTLTAGVAARTTNSDGRLYNVAATLDPNLNTSNFLDDEDEEFIKSYESIDEEPFDLDISNHLRFPEGGDNASFLYDLKGHDGLKGHDDLKDCQ
ncbi:uncharacterized protein TOT_010001238 [Theileria orientalis strain Shintoku]|uniref:ELM2 domain-containing protein n=1 Tax=Theileria orientalis strain Shintoku TaxID=869250 RepID=J4C7C9_THEOR|nr:uncharacterized protein TOT_010001238 [Theileria orientalis strain Shintoku]PVC52350.1 hypothetical protein MACL_00000864 [Theileria orientalis]BAM38818.1 uncharacterized protein TOT_010001238 [Theileria orientalis strain Shintoku]|eukprot:XP_009689119.1 uncharacterized protein TOT_010001238 [Theileria orientalis strain Shintoku]